MGDGSGIAVSLCDDNLMHVFAVFDDGFGATPACGALVGPERRGGDDDSPVCDPCLLLIADMLDIDKEAFLGGIQRRPRTPPDGGDNGGTR